jgi:glycosyltransferase involved in cell wall biosynthesis
MLAAAQANLAMARRLRRAGRGIVHVHAPVWYGALRWGLKFSGSTRVVHVHIEEDEGMLRWAMKSPPELVITCARFLVGPARLALPANANTQVIAVPNAVDTEKFAPGDKLAAKQKVGAPLDRPLVLMLANLAPHKGQATAIQAIARLKQQGRAVTCWLAGVERGGATDYTQQLERLIREANVADRVTLLGQRSDAPDLMRAADVFLLPSTHEGLPLCILEAQAAQVPVVAAPTAGVPEIIHDGETGYLVAADDVIGYAQRIESLLAAPALGAQLASAAYEQVMREHRWPTYVERITAIYDDLLLPRRQPLQAS